MSHQEFLVTLNVSLSQEEAMVDFLLTLESERGFSSFPVNAHDHRNQGLSLAEQVTGRQKKMRFQMYVDKEQLASFLTQLKKNFQGSDIHYWVIPVVEHGMI